MALVNEHFLKLPGSYLFHQLFLQSSKMEVEYLFGDIFIYWLLCLHLYN